MNPLSHIWALKPIWVTILAFLIPMELVLNYDPELETEMKCAYGIIAMAILWVTEAIPIPVTALLPIFLFPMMGVDTPKNMSGSYITDTSMLFFGGLVVAVALEESGLHKRISLLVMRVVGARPVLLMLGLMVTTWFLSMWISNTAASSMMIPIISAVLETVREVRRNSAAGNDGTVNEGYEMDDVYVNGEVNPDNVNVSQTSKRQYVVQTSTKEDNDEIKRLAKAFAISVEYGFSVGGIATLSGTPSNLVMKERRQYVVQTSTTAEDSEEIKRLAKAFALSVAYGANVGGIATLTGTPPNLVMKERVDELYQLRSGDPNIEVPITFANWMGFAFPLSFICLILCWIWLQLFFLRCWCFNRMSSTERKAINVTILQQYRDLGRITFAEVEVLCVFILLVILWLFRKPPNIDGWGELFTKGDVNYVSDSTPSILLGCLLFILPKEVPKVFCLAESDGPSYKPILTWKAVAQKLPWGVIILLGGGFALAKASTSSGLSAWVGNELEVLKDLDPWVMNLIICIIVAGMTELTSNTATATLLMPIMAALAQSVGVHQMYLMMSAAVACSFAFMLPVATPPNAIVFSTGYLSVIDMVIAGLPMNVIAIAVLTLAVNTWGKSMYDLDNIPHFLKEQIATTTTAIMNTTLTTTAMVNTTLTTPVTTP